MCPWCCWPNSMLWSITAAELCESADLIYNASTYKKLAMAESSVFDSTNWQQFSHLQTQVFLLEMLNPKQFGWLWRNFESLVIMSLLRRCWAVLNCAFLLSLSLSSSEYWYTNFDIHFLLSKTSYPKNMSILSAAPQQWRPSNPANPEKELHLLALVGDAAQQPAQKNEQTST